MNPAGTSFPLAGASGDIDWEMCVRALVHGKPRVPIEKVDYLTPAEWCLLLDQDLDTPRAPSYSEAVGNDVDAHLARIRAMQPWDRLKRAVQGWE